MPEETMASAACLIRSSLTSQANLFQLFQPIGGVRARPLSSARRAGAAASRARAAIPKAARPANVFMTMLSVITQGAFRRALGAGTFLPFLYLTAKWSWLMLDCGVPLVWLVKERGGSRCCRAPST